MKKKKTIILFPLIFGGIILGVSIITIIALYKPPMSILGTIGDSSVKIEANTGIKLQGLVPELNNVVKNSSGEIVDIRLKKPSISLASDSLFINENDAVPLSDVTVSDTIYLNKLGPKFTSLINEGEIRLEICRLSDCSKKLILKVPNNLRKPSSTEKNDSILSKTIGNAYLEGKGYKLLGTVDLTHSSTMKSASGDLVTDYTGSLDKTLGYSSKTGILSYKIPHSQQKENGIAYEFEVNGNTLNKQKPIYLISSDGDGGKVTYSYFDKESGRARFIIGGKINTLTGKFSDTSLYSIILEVNGTKGYIISILDSTGKLVWSGKGGQQIDFGSTIYIGNNVGSDVSDGYIKGFSIYTSPL